MLGGRIQNVRERYEFFFKKNSVKVKVRRLLFNLTPTRDFSLGRQLFKYEKKFVPACERRKKNEPRRHISLYSNQ